MLAKDLFTHLQADNGRQMRMLWNTLTVGTNRPSCIGSSTDQVTKVAVIVASYEEVPASVPASVRIGGEDVSIVATGIRPNTSAGLM